MRKIQRNDFQFVTFDELDPGRGAPSLRTVRGKMDSRLVEPVWRHLKSGVLCAEVGEEPADIFDLDAMPDEDYCFVTDGKWIWRRMLAYYVKEHKCMLDERFVGDVLSGANTPGGPVDLQRAFEWIARFGR